MVIIPSFGVVVHQSDCVLPALVFQVHDALNILRAMNSDEFEQHVRETGFICHALDFYHLAKEPFEQAWANAALQHVPGWPHTVGTLLVRQLNFTTQALESDLFREQVIEVRVKWSRFIIKHLVEGLVEQAPLGAAIRKAKA